MKLYTAQEIAELLNVSVKTIRRYAKNGQIGLVQPGGRGARTMFYLKEEVNHEGA